MKLELTVFQLGKALKDIGNQYNLNLLVKKNLSGGWLTIVGEAIITDYPTEENRGNNNIININIKGSSSEGTTIKLIGAKGKKFNVDISPAQYKSIPKKGLILNQVKINENECALRIDDNIIFTIKESAEKIIGMINQLKII